MSDDKNPKESPSNPIFSAALGMLEHVVPGALNDPERALHELAPRLRFLVVAKVEKPTIPQLEVLQKLDGASSLVQIRKALQAGNLQFGPFPGDLAEKAFMPGLLREGLSASLRELTAEEKAGHLAGLDDEPG